jgi:cell fate (sporulation/competence/biofilm development) regulator YlbF (YheA/YmcA/DUF963 family)
MNIYDAIDQFANQLKVTPECVHFKAAQKTIQDSPDLKAKVESYLKEQAIMQARNSVGMAPSQDEIESFNQKTREMISIPEIADFFQAQMQLMPILKTISERITDAAGIDASFLGGMLSDLMGE